MDERTDRRGFLKAIAAVGATAAATGTAGCVDSITGGGGGGGDGASASATVKKLPAATDGLFWMDVEGLLNDEAIKKMVNASIEVQKDQPYYNGPESYDEALKQWNEETKLDTSKLKSMVFFAENSTITEKSVEEFGGGILRSDWTAEEIKTQAEEEGAKLQKGRLAGKDIYEPATETTPADSSLFAVLEEGTFAFAENKDHLRTIIEAWTGNGDRIDSKLTSSFKDTRKALIRSVWRFPTEQVPEDAGGQQVNVAALKNVEVVTMTAYKDGNTRGMEMKFKAGSEQGAKDISKAFKGVKPLLGLYATGEAAQSRIDKIKISQSGSTATITYEASIQNWVDLVKTLAELDSGGMGGGGMGGGRSQSAPMVSFSFQFDQSGGSVTITHDGGDTINSQNTGELRYGVRGSSMSTWQLPVAAGDSATVDGVSSGDSVVVVWEAPGGGRTQLLAEYEVP